MIVKAENFSLKQIAESGQCFRMDEIPGTGFYKNIAGGKILLMRQIGENEIYFSCTEEEYRGFWEDYFDLRQNYEAKRKAIERIAKEYDNPEMLKAIEYGRGIRILKQGFWEASVSYILSQNNKIPRIKTAIHNICEMAGEEIMLEDSFLDIAVKEKAFPCPGALMAVPESILYEYAFFYRLPYLHNFIEAIKNGFINPAYLHTADYQLAKMALMDVKGIGEKVADCICLYGLGKTEAFPVDTWVKNTLLKWHGQNEKYAGMGNAKAVREIIADHYDIYGPYKGLAQQYLFYYERTKGKNERKGNEISRNRL